MTKEINYPIKYAVLELKERGGWSAGYEDITQGFIVSKCYVVESNVVYHSDGTNTINHVVVFPFKDISAFKNSIGNVRQNIGVENIPHYDVCDRPYPVNIVSDLFDSYESAKALAAQKNEEYKKDMFLRVPIARGETLSSLNWNERFDFLKKEFENNLELCNLFEQLVLAATDNMCISQDSTVKILKPTKQTNII